MTKTNSKNLNILPKHITPFEVTHRHYNSHFFDAHRELDSLLETEFPYDEPKIMDNRLTAVRAASKLYIKYIKVANKFIKCYKNIANPQKRRYLRKICDGCIGRILELKNHLVTWEMSDFHFLDQMLLGMSLFPPDMDVNIPEYFTECLSDDEKQKKEIVEYFLKAKREKETEEKAVFEEVKTVRKAMVLLRMIQGHERTRQAREYFCDAQKRHLRNKMENQMESRKFEKFEKSRRDYAVIIQKAWRRYRSQKMLKTQYLSECKFLNMFQSHDKKQINKGIEEYRIAIIKRNEEEYMSEKEKIKQDMLTYQAPKMIEDLEEKIRKYFYEYKDKNGEFPLFPSTEKLGSDALLAVDPLKVKQLKEESMLESKSEKSDKSSKSSDTKSEKGGKKSGKEKDEPVTYILKSSKYLPLITEQMKEYYRKWFGKDIAALDKFDVNILKDDVENEVKLMIRLQVDEKMRKELFRLSEALRRDKKKKPKKKKKGKKGKKKKVRVEKDLTPDRSVESLVEELVNQGIIKDYPKHSLKEFLGEYNYSGSIQQLSKDATDEPLPCLADIRRVINEYCILPMGSEDIHQGGTFVKSVLLVGPRGSGKTFLMHSICSEIRATLFDLSAENIEGKYPGEDGLEMLLHLVLKVGRLLQPSVVFIKDADYSFWKKKPPKKTLNDSGRLKKKLPKLIKKIRSSDRLLFFGTSSLPFEMNVKILKKCFSKIICIFKPDYNCRIHLWKEFINKFGGIPGEKLYFSVLGNISDGFVASHIFESVAQVLTHRRLNFQEKIPLCTSDFLFSLAEHIPVYDEEHFEYLKWLKKLPLGKKRVELYDKELEEEPEEEATSEEDDY